MRTELQNVDQRVAKIESTLQQLANVVVLTARQDEKLNAIERRVDRLEQGSAVRHHVWNWRLEALWKQEGAQTCEVQRVPLYPPRG